MTRITRMILVLGKSALSVPDTRFSRVSGSTLLSTMDAPEAQSVLVRSTHTHTLQPGEQRLSCGLCVQRLFNNSKDGILQQSPIELILTLSLGFREERMCEGKKKRGYNA